MTDNDHLWSSAVYTPEEIRDGKLPSLVYAHDSVREAADISILLPDLMPLQTPDPLPLEMLGYTYDAPSFRHDGSIEGAQHLPEYYAYSPDRSNTWEEGLETIDDFDWALNDEQHERDGATHTSATNLTTEPCAETTVLSLIYSNQQAVEVSQNPPSPKSLVQKENAIQITPDAVPSPSWIPSPSKIQDSDAASISEVVSAKSALEVEVEPEGGRSNATTTSTEAEIEPEGVATPVVPDPSHPNTSSIREPQAHDIAEPKDHSANHNVVGGLLTLPDDVEGKAYGAETLSDVSRNILVHTEDPDTFGTLAARFSDFLVLSNLETSALFSPTSNVSTEEAQCKTDSQGEDKQLHDGVDVVPNSSLELSPLEDIECMVPGEDDPCLESNQDVQSEVPEQSLTLELKPEPMSTLFDHSEEMEVEELESGDAKEEQSRALPPFSAMMQILSLPVTTGTSTAADEQTDPKTSAPTIVADDLLKRTRSTRTDTSSDNEGAAPARKKSKAGSPTESAVIFESTSSEVDETKAELPIDALKRLTPTKSPKEGGEGVTRESLEITQEGNNTHEPSPENPNAKEAEIYLAEAIATPEVDPARTLPHAEEYDEPLMKQDNYYMQEHLSDVQDSSSELSEEPLLVPDRAPTNHVSNRELASLGSSLTPGMHLSRHLYDDPMPARVRKSTQKMSDITDGSSLVGEDDESEILPSSKRKRTAPAISNRTAAPRKGKVEPPAKKARSRAAVRVKTEKRYRTGADASDEDEYEVNDTSHATKAHTPLPKEAASQKARQPTTRKNRNTPSAKTPAPTPSSRPTAYTKRQTRGDTKRAPSRSASPATSSAAQADTAQIKTRAKHDVDGGSIEPAPTAPAPTPKSTKKTPARSALLKNISTPSSSLMRGGSGTPAKNKFGFSPRKTRSQVVKTPGTVKGKGTKGKTAAVKDDGKRVEKEIGEGIEKRLRSKD